MKKLIFKIYALLLPAVVFATPNPPEPVPAGPTPPPITPIDGYVWLFILLGCLYVFYKRRSILNNN